MVVPILITNIITYSSQFHHFIGAGEGDLLTGGDLYAVSLTMLLLCISFEIANVLMSNASSIFIY